MILNSDFLVKSLRPILNNQSNELCIRVEAPKDELGIYTVGDDIFFFSVDEKSIHLILLICKFFLG